jgi:hypothetical protein
MVGDQHFPFLGSKGSKVYFFELSTSNQAQTLKLVNISRESEKGAKNSYGSYPTEFVLEVQKSIGSIWDQIIQ